MFESGAKWQSEGGVGAAMGDVQEMWYVFLIVMILALVIGFGFMILLRHTVGIIVWTAIGLVFALLGGAGGYMMVKGAECLETDSKFDAAAVATAGATLTGVPNADATCPEGYKKPEADREQHKYMAYVLFGIAGLYALIVLCMCSRIQLGVAINKVAAKFIGQNKAIILLPVIQAGISFVWWAIWMIIASFIVSQVSDNALGDDGKKAWTRDEALGKFLDLLEYCCVPVSGPALTRCFRRCSASANRERNPN